MRDAMKYMISMMAAMLMACSSCAHTGHDERPDTSQLPAVGRLMATYESGVTRFNCTAWKLDEDLVATAGHCCRDDVTYTLAGPNAIPGTEARIIVDMYDGDDGEPVEDDVCVMRGHLNGPSIGLALHDPPIGSHVWTLGYPHGVFIISEGIWSGRNDDGENNLGICSSVVNPGASGSPIMNSSGQAVGVLVQYMPGMDNMTFVAPIERLRFAVRKARSMKHVPDEITED